MNGDCSIWTLARIALLACWAGASGPLAAAVVFETTTPHHHIRVLDEGGRRIMSFNGSQETRMSLANTLQGHFEYTEYFHLPWVWNPRLTNVLMIGLGGATTQRAYLHYYPDVKIDTVEIDPAVLTIAQRFFYLPDTPRHRVLIEDGRQNLRRSQQRYDLIVMDAYRTTRYGSFIPYHLVTREFFEIARDRLSEEGVLAYNVIGTMQGWRADILGAAYRTLKAVFSQVYLFPAKDSLNVVLIGTREKHPLTLQEIRLRAAALAGSKRVTLPGFPQRASSVQLDPPRSAPVSPVLTDDFAPVDGLLTSGKR